jgi:hypothetical protein
MNKLVKLIALMIVCCGCGMNSQSDQSANPKSSIRAANLQPVAEFLLNRELSREELKKFIQCETKSQSQDYLAFLARNREFDEILTSLKMIDSKGERHAKRNLTFSRLYFNAARTLRKTDYRSVVDGLDATTDLLLLTMLKENPILCEDHQVQVTVTENHIRNYENAYSFFGMICGATEDEIKAGVVAERKDTLTNFENAKGETRLFFQRTDAEITTQREAWDNASDQQKADVREKAKTAYKDGGFWALMPILNEFATVVNHSRLIAPDERIAEVPNLFFVNAELKWAIEIVETAIGSELDTKGREEIKAQILTDFKSNPASTHLAAIQTQRDRFFAATSPAIRSDYRLAHLRHFYSATPIAEAPLNFLHESNEHPLVATAPESQELLLIDWHLESLDRWMNMIAWLAEIPAPTPAQRELQREQMVTKYRESENCRRFFHNYPKFVDDALAGWDGLSPKQRKALRTETKKLYANTKSLADCARPLSQLSIATRQTRLKQSLDYFESELIKMQIQQMAFTMQAQANATVLNALSESSAIMGAGMDSEVIYGGPGSLTIDGNTHIYPVPQANFIGQYASMASMSGVFQAMFKKQIATVENEFKYLKSIQDIVDAGGISK